MATATVTVSPTPEPPAAELLPRQERRLWPLDLGQNLVATATTPFLPLARPPLRYVPTA